MQVYNLDATNLDVKALWHDLYFGIERANLLLANIKKPQMDETKRSVIEGEALFLRSYYYFLLVSNWGDVPLILSPTSSVTSTDVARTPAKAVYAQIVKDMTKAEGLVNTATNLKFGGRVSKTAIQGILARVCLYMAGEPINDKSQYAEALKWADKVILSQEHTLNPTYQQIFINYAKDLYDVKESMWEVEFWGNRVGNAYTETGRVGNTNGIACNDNNEGQSYGFISATGTMFRLYPAFVSGNQSYSPDSRRDWVIAPYRYNGSTATKVLWTAANVYDRNSGKFRREYEVLAKQKNFTPQNWPILRYSDVLLMKAEAENEVNNMPTPAAIDAVNQVRRRSWAPIIKSITITSGGTGYTSTPTVTVTGGGSTGTTATATISGGKVIGISIIAMGTPFNSAPTITITGGGGTGATATATVYSMSEADLTSTETSSYSSFQQLIRDERARELCFEALRRNDLIRWGVFISEMKAVANDITLNAPATLKYAATAGKNVSERNLLFPIPLSEIALNKALVQNKGW
jgi:hypothetical protein